jgi:SulP family sulfate permease
MTRGHRRGGPERRLCDLFRARSAVLASSNDPVVIQVDYAGDPDDVAIDTSQVHVWDASSVAAPDAITTKHAAR